MSRRGLAGLVALVLVATAACGSDDGPDASVVTEPGSTEPAPAAGACPGTEVGPIPATIEVDADEPPYDDDRLRVEPLGVAADADGRVFFNLPFSVYCIADDTLYEVATPETVPYPEGEEESSYADIAVSAEGHPLVVDWMNPRTFEIADGEATVVPGTDDPAIGGSRSIDVGPDGTIYLTGLDRSGTTDVYAVEDGEARVVAGGGDFGIAGDGGPATESYLDEPEGIHVDPEGDLYIADRGNARVAVVSPDGTIDTLAGGERFEDRPDSDALASPTDVAVDAEGVVHVLDTDNDPKGLWRVEDDGSTTVLSGDSSECELFSVGASGGPESCPLDEIRLDLAYRMAFDPDDVLWVTRRDTLLRIEDDEVELAVTVVAT